MSLVERIEGASGRDMQLGHDILVAVGKRHPDAVKAFGFPMPHMDPTVSIDAALDLVPEEMRDEIEITTLYQVARVTINMNHGPDGSPFYGNNESNSIPLAICAAALKAREASNG